MRCIAIDDEPLALRQLASYIQKVPGLELVGSCSSAIEALKIIDVGGADLIFCDISMPDMSGLELVRQVADRCLVVFTTAHAEHAIEGYKVEAVDYLLKPFSLADVASAAARARKRFEGRERPAPENCLTPSDFIYIKNDSKMSRVRVADIDLVEGMSEYVRFYVRGERHPLTSLISMKRVEASLPPSLFMRVHRSWIVNLESIESVSHLRITIAGQLVPVSDNYKERFVGYMESHSMK